MRPSGQPWLGLQQIEPWSFTYSPGLVGGLRSRSLKEDPQDETRLPEEVEVDETPRRMADSYVEVRSSLSASSDQHLSRKPTQAHLLNLVSNQINLPLSSDPALLANYVSTSGGLRIGKLTEHLDSLAGAIAYKHVYQHLATELSEEGRPEEKKVMPVYLATASADRLDLFKDLLVRFVLHQPLRIVQ